MTFKTLGLILYTFPVSTSIHDSQCSPKVDKLRTSWAVQCTIVHYFYLSTGATKPVEGLEKRLRKGELVKRKLVLPPFFLYECAKHIEIEIWILMDCHNSKSVESRNWGGY